MKYKDWTGNKNSVFKTLGASNHTDKERQEMIIMPQTLWQ